MIYRVESGKCRECVIVRTQGGLKKTTEEQQSVQDYVSFLIGQKLVQTIEGTE